MDEAVQPVEAVDINRYMGRWFEIARYPAFFQRRCAKNTVAEYALRANGTVSVENRCTTSEGRTVSTRGTARSADRSGAKFKVKFFPLMPAGDYWIIDLDGEYRWAVVSEPRRRYLWILSRTPALDDVTLDGIRRRLREQRYDLERLVFTVHDGA